MKKQLISISLAATFALTAAANAADGVINFTGNITTAACTVSTGTLTQTVNMGTINTSAFNTTAGTSVAPTRFNITLSDCPTTLSTASIKFDGTPNSTNSSLLALSSGQTATGVGIAIFESDGNTLIPLQTASGSKALTTTGSINMTYIAKYMSTSSTVTAGSANSVANFTIAYN